MRRALLSETSVTMLFSDPGDSLLRDELLLLLSDRLFVSTCLRECPYLSCGEERVEWLLLNSRRVGEYLTSPAPELRDDWELLFSVLFKMFASASFPWDTDEVMEDDLRTGAGGLGPTADPMRCKVLALRGRRKPVDKPKGMISRLIENIFNYSYIPFFTSIDFKISEKFQTTTPHFWPKKNEKGKAIIIITI